MSCFGMVSTGMPLSPSPSRRRRGERAWRWWRRCAGLAAAVHSKIRRRAVRWPVQGGRRLRRSSVSSSSSSSLRSGWRHHRGLAPVYVDELYSRPRAHHAAVHEVSQQQQPTTSADKLAARAGAASYSAAAADAPTNAGASNAAAAAGGKVRAGVRSVLMSPRRVAGMGEVDLRAELFIRKFREEMRLQRQQSADDFHAMLARGL
ncbi:hypothetical protein ABZP36_024898 [Zizania latifolia]